MLLTAGQISKYKSAALMIDALPPAKQLLREKGYDANWLRQALAARGITACISSKANRAKPNMTAWWRARLKAHGRIGPAKQRPYGRRAGREISGWRIRCFRYQQ